MEGTRVDLELAAANFMKFHSDVRLLEEFLNFVKEASKDVKTWGENTWSVDIFQVLIGAKPLALVDLDDTPRYTAFMKDLKDESIQAMYLFRYAALQFGMKIRMYGFENDDIAALYYWPDNEKRADLLVKLTGPECEPFERILIQSCLLGYTFDGFLKFERAETHRDRLWPVWQRVERQLSEGATS